MSGEDLEPFTGVYQGLCQISIDSTREWIESFETLPKPRGMKVLKRNLEYTFCYSNSYLYFLGNFFYFMNALLIVIIDGATYYNPIAQNFTYYIDSQNDLYLASAVCHLTSAVFYVLMWISYFFFSGRKINIYLVIVFFIFTIPDLIFNIAEAALWTVTAAWYNYENATIPYLLAPSQPPSIPGIPTVEVYQVDPVLTYFVVPKELAAAMITLVAGILWCLQWWWQFPRVKGRGLNFNDMDFWGCLTYIIASITYVLYEGYTFAGQTSALYIVGDWMYFGNSIIYLILSFRDSGWFLWWPLDDKLICCVERAPKED